MQQNVGPTERWLRLAAGGALTYVAFRWVGPGRLAPAALLAAGAVLFETGVTRVCPLNTLLGIGTTSLSERLPDPAGEQIASVQRPPADS